jgi:hypothetical protein
MKSFKLKVFKCLVFLKIKKKLDTPGGEEESIIDVNESKDYSKKNSLDYEYKNGTIKS